MPKKINTEEIDTTASEAVDVPTDTTRRPKGPALVWNEDRDVALIEGIAAGLNTTSDLVDHLRDHESFGEVPSEAVTTAKIAHRIKRLRDDGLELPQFGRSARYQPNIDRLRELLG